MAFTVPVRFTLLAVRVIKPAAVETSLVTVILLPVRLIVPFPVPERFEPTVMQPLAALATSDRLPLAGRLMAAVTAMLPVVLLPIVSVPAVMLPISVDVRPKLPVDFVPRSTTVPDVGISSTEPEVVAFTVLVIVTFWAVI